MPITQITVNSLHRSPVPLIVKPAASPHRLRLSIPRGAQAEDDGHVAHNVPTREPEIAVTLAAKEDAARGRTAHARARVAADHAFRLAARQRLEVPEALGTPFPCPMSFASVTAFKY